MNIKRDFAIAVLGLALAIGGATAASAAPHPRRAEVNHRLANENARIHHNLVTGKITPAEAAQEHREVHSVRVQERIDASEHGGHITKGEQVQLNREENAVSRQIYNDAH